MIFFYIPIVFDTNVPDFGLSYGDISIIDKARSPSVARFDCRTILKE